MGFWKRIFGRGSQVKGRVKHNVDLSLRNFSGADSGRLFDKWRGMGEPIDEYICQNLDLLRARAMDQFVNNDFVRRYVEMVQVNVCGPQGVTMQGAVTRSNGEPDDFANKALERCWADWGRPENCSVNGGGSWLEMQSQALAGAALSGEIIAVTHAGKGYGKYAFQIQHISPELLETSHNERLAGGRYIRMGVEYDSTGRKVAYHFRTTGPTGMQSRNGRRYQRVLAKDVVHTFKRDHVGQTRGYPWVSTALASLKQLDAYFEAALVAARAGASKMGFIHTQEGTEYTGDGIDSDGSIITDFEAGTVEKLPFGTTFTPFDPKYPHEQFAEFVKSMLQSVASSLGVSYSALSGNLEGVNYSSIRSGVIEEREGWKARQQWFIDGYCRPIFERWLTAALLVDAIQLGGKPLSGDESRYKGVRFQGRRWSWVDPKKDTDSNVTAIDNNITTVSAVIREQGRDPDEVFAERAKEKQRMAALGLITEEVITNE